MALPHIFHEVKFLSPDVKTSNIKGNKGYITTLVTGGRTIDISLQDKVSSGISTETSTRRIRVQGTRDVRQLSRSVTHVGIEEDIYAIKNRMEDVEPTYIDFLLEGL